MNEPHEKMNQILNLFKDLCENPENKAIIATVLYLLSEEAVLFLKRKDEK